MDSRWRKALFIAEELGEDAEDVYDVLLGNVTEPREFVDAVELQSQNYDFKKEQQLR